MTVKPPEDVMAGRMHRLGWAGAFLVFVLAVTMGYSLWRGSERREVVNLPVLRAVPEFSLTDQTGEAVSKDSLRGNIWIANFFFTRCQGPCPQLNARMAEMQKALAKAPGVKLVSVSVDPAHDTTEVLRKYGEEFQADPAKWKLLTGDPDVVKKLVREGFAQMLEDGPDAQPVHGTIFLMVDGHGMVRGVYMLEDPELIPKMLLDAGNLLREQGQG
ncbi:MAG: SCO family protein [Chthoniobacterales bacterium]|jgi:protein SCO1/2